MKAITLRDIPDAVAKVIEREAESSGASLNKTVIDMLSRAINSPRRRGYHDLDHLIGRWGAADANAVDADVAEQVRQVVLNLHAREQEA